MTASATAPGLAVSRFKRQLSPDQAVTLTGIKVTDRAPNVSAATLAEDMATGTPAFAYLPIIAPDAVEDFRRALCQAATAPPGHMPDRDPLRRFARQITAAITRAVDSVDAAPEWQCLAAIDWEPSWTPVLGSEYHGDHPGLASSSWVAVAVVRDRVRGGFLDIPEYQATLESRHGWVAAFPRGLVRGVSPTRPTRESGYRHSWIFGDNAI